jgi:hypothetical protein
VLLAGAHPAVLQRNARRFPRQLWMSRYIVFFQLGAAADRRVARHDFAYVERLWRRWAPGFTVPPGHLAHVKRTLAASMPAPVAMYRGGGFAVPEQEIRVPTLYICGADDGCALPGLADGQEELFTGGYRSQVWEGTGHFPHLEQPERTAGAVLGWLRAQGNLRVGRAQEGPRRRPSRPRRGATTPRDRGSAPRPVGFLGRPPGQQVTQLRLVGRLELERRQVHRHRPVAHPDDVPAVPHGRGLAEGVLQQPRHHERGHDGAARSDGALGRSGRGLPPGPVTSRRPRDDHELNGTAA